MPIKENRIDAYKPAIIAMRVEATGIAKTKLSLTITEALFRGILCNILVCLAVWMSFAAHTLSSKVMVIVPPIAAFVAIGFEHSVANMYVIPLAMIGGVTPYDLAGFVQNLAVVTVGNVLGGVFTLKVRPNMRKISVFGRSIC